MYTKGEVIWAKIKGFPWWPGIIAKVIDDKENSHGNTELLVNFIGENSHAQLSLDKVAKFQEKYDEYAKMKKKKLLHSIEIANKIVRGETTFQAELEKLEDKDSFSNKKLPSHNIVVNQRKRVDSKSDDKSLSNGMQYDSDATSPNDSDMNHLLMSPYDNAKKHQAPERKNSRKGSDFIVGRKSSQVEKSPALNKTMRNRGNSKREAEENLDSEEPKLMKAFKLDENIDELHGSKQKEDDQTEKTDKTEIKSSPILNNIDAVFSFNNSAVTESFNAKNSRKNSSALINISNEPIKAKTNDFDILRDLIIEKITNSGSPSVCGTILEKSIEDVISKINPETVSISEIVENDLGRNIYTLIILLDELFSSVPIDAESELYDMKDQLVTFNDIIKSRLVLHFAENADFCSVWLKKLETKREEKAALKALEEVKKPPQQPLKVAENIEKNEKKKKTEKTPRRVPEGCENTNLRSEKSQMDEEKPATLQINFEEYRFEGEKKKSGLIDRIPKMVTTSTKITKPIYNSAVENSKMDTTQKPGVMNPTLRKKICLKMAKILQDKYNLEKNASQEMTLKIETKIRNINPDMQMEYKNKILIVLRLLKYSLINIEDFVNNFTTDFYILQQKLETFTKQNADAHLDTNFGEDSPSLAKEISQDAALISLKLDEFKNGENQEGIAQIA